MGTLWQQDLKASDGYACDDLLNIYTQQWIYQPLQYEIKVTQRFKQYLDEVAVLGIKEAAMSKGKCASAWPTGTVNHTHPMCLFL